MGIALPMEVTKTAPPHDLWAVAAYFNPSGFRRRLANYRTFRSRLDVPLATVELSFGKPFELSAGDADILIQIRDGDVMWQKERLLNLAVAALPADCTKVAILDCDLVFGSPDWAQRTSAALDEVPLLQPFSHAYRTPPGWTADGLTDPGDYVLHAAAWLIESGMTVDDALRGIGNDIGCAHGLAWAARRELLAEHGLYDASIVGGGDTCLFRAAYGYMGLVVERFRLDRPHARHYRDWAEPFYAAVGGKVGYAAGHLYHLWHGSVDDRRYMERHETLAGFAFHPREDVALSDSGAWRWNTPKDDMHRYLESYFGSRHEDG